MLQKDKKGKGKNSCGWSFGQQTNGTDISKKNRCRSEDHLIAKCPMPPKDNEKRRKQVRFNENFNCARDNSKNNSDQKIYASMASMSNNKECPSETFGDSSQ